MRRDSAPAGDIVELLRDAGVTLRGRAVTRRTVADLSQKRGLLPGEEPTQVIARFRELDALGYGPGRSSDHIFRVMLTRHYPCPAVRLALIGEAVGDLDVLKVADPTQRPRFLDAMRADIEGLGRCVEEGFSHSSSLGASFVAPLVDKVARSTAQGGRTDYTGSVVGPLTETPEQRRSVLALGFAQAIVGDDVNDISPFIDMLRIATQQKPLRSLEDPTFDEENSARVALDEAHRSWFEWFGVVQNSPLSELEAAAVEVREGGVLEEMKVLKVLDDGLDDEQLDDLAACFAPAWLQYKRQKDLQVQPLA